MRSNSAHTYEPTHHVILCGVQFPSMECLHYASVPLRITIRVFQPKIHSEKVEAINRFFTGGTVNRELHVTLRNNIYIGVLLLVTNIEVR